MSLKKFAAAWKRALKDIEKEKAEASARKLILDDPFTIELLEKFAEAHDYHFDIIRADGTVFRFHKKEYQAEKQGTEVW